MTDPNSHQALAPNLSAQVLADIEGLDPEKHGFCREKSGCGGDYPSTLAGSFNTLQLHVFQSSEAPPSAWNGDCSNVAGYAELSAKLKGDSTRVTAFHREGVDPMVLACRWDATTGMIMTTQYSGGNPGEIPWDAAGVVAADRSEERFVFVCSHTKKDGRCGYCGPILVEALRKEIEKQVGNAAPFHVFPCNHVGGHAYAGNVIVISKFQATCFGCVKPTDVGNLVSFVLGHKDANVPESLSKIVRGKMGAPNPPAS